MNHIYRTSFIFLVLALVASNMIVSAEYQYSRSLSANNNHFQKSNNQYMESNSSPDAHLLFDTEEGFPQGYPSRFAIATSYGLLKGVYFRFSGTTQVIYTLGSETISLSAGPFRENEQLMPVRLAVSNLGTAEYEVDFLTGETRLVESSITDCTSLVSNEAYLAAIEAKQSISELFDALDPSNADSTDFAVGAIYLSSRLAAHLPELISQCDVADPLYGVCVIHYYYSDCMNCCEQHRDIDVAVTLICSGIALYTNIPIIGAACLGTFGGNICINVTCFGKVGVDPVYCGADGVGYCLAACPNQDAISGMCPNEYLVCCESR